MKGCRADRLVIDDPHLVATERERAIASLRFLVDFNFPPPTLKARLLAGERS